MIYFYVITYAAAILCHNEINAAKLSNRNDIELENDLESNVIAPRHKRIKNFIQMTQTPPETIAPYPGDVIEITCGAMTTPAGSVQWMKNDVPIMEHDMETNAILHTSQTSIARVSSTLIVPSAPIEMEDVYTCIVNAGLKTLTSITTVYPTGKDSELSDIMKLLPMRPRVVFFYRDYMDTIGNNVVLPCKAKGHPHPAVHWRDNTGEMVGRRNPRMKVLKSGELLISSLRWSDMGEYDCIAKNSFGKDKSTTFLYPVKSG